MNRLKNFLTRTFRGDSHIVAVIVIMVVVIALGVIFKDELGKIVDALFSKLNGFMTDI